MAFALETSEKAIRSELVNHPQAYSRGMDAFPLHRINMLWTMRLPRALHIGLAVLALSAAYPAGRGHAAPRHGRVAQALPIQIPAATQAQLPVALDPSVKGDGQRTVMTFTVSRPVEAVAAVIERPDRVVIDLPEVNFQFGADHAAKGAGLASAYRFGLFGAGRSRIVIDLAQPALVAATVGPARSDGTALVEVILTRTDRDAFQAAARTLRVRDPVTTAALPAEDAADKRPLVVLDPGHGGVDPGAMSKNGTAEKQVVFEISRRVHELLIESGRVRVQMTRTRDVFVSLGERVAIARKGNADLFVSFHADMLSGHEGVRGASIYTGSEKATDAEAARLAESENKADAAAGIDQADEVQSDVADILSDLTRRETRVFSHRFAKTLGTRMGDALPMHKKPLREAGFKVLRAPDVPSALIELGYLSNASDSEFLLSPDGQAKAAAAVARAIEHYFERRAQP